jgi:hypothetical protein
VTTSIYGIDFSGGTHAGKKIWIASARCDDGRLLIEEVVRGDTLPGSSAAREDCLPALCRFIAGRGDATLGLDFPFALPQRFMPDATWRDFALAFGHRYEDPTAFRAACRAVTGGKALKRRTDVETKTPFSPYNLWIYRQTFHGIRDLLAPLVRDDVARVLPMQEAATGKPSILEICPASTLKRFGTEIGRDLYKPYKGRQPERRAHRRRVLATLEEHGVVLSSRQLRPAVVSDPEGDALDAIVAAFGTFRALRHPEYPRPEWHPLYATEGYVYT